MSVTITAPVNGDALDPDALRADLDSVREWLAGGIVAADLAAEGIPRIAFPPPSVLGFPVHGSVGELQDVRGYFVNAPTVFYIKPEILNTEGRAKIAGLCYSKHLKQGDLVYLFAGWHAQAFLPGGVAIGDYLGKFVLEARRYVSDSESAAFLDIDEVRRKFYATTVQASSSRAGRQFYMCARYPVPQDGRYDFSVLFDQDGSTNWGADTNDRIEIRRPHFCLDAIGSIF